MWNIVESTIWYDNVRKTVHAGAVIMWNIVKSMI